MNYEMEIIRFSHFFKVTKIQDRNKRLLYAFIKEYVQMGIIKDSYNKSIYAPIKVFAASNKYRTDYRFHINVFDHFIEFLLNNKVDIANCNILEVPLYSPATIDVKIKDGWKPFDYQVPMIQYFKNDDSNSKFLDLQTGKGKSYIATQAIVDLKLRTVIMVRPLFMEKWGQDLLKMTNVNPKKILMIQGNSQLRGLINIAKEDNFDYPFIVISNKTFQAFMSNYENDPTGCYDEYGINLEDFYPLLKAGISLVDEIHLDFHLNFKIQMYTHIPKAFGLSATLFHDDDFIEKMYRTMFPMNIRFNSTVMEKYIEAYAILYNQSSKARIKIHEFASKNYSHNAYEKSILKNPSYKTQYFEMIKHYIGNGYLSSYKPGQKLIIYVASIKMATALTEYLKLTYLDLDVRRYVEEDPYENLLDADIRVTTILSGGVGHDIENLTMVLMTTAIKSSQANVQALGRLRKLKDGTPTKFYYFTNLDIKKHVEYHELKKEMLEKRAKSFKEFFYPNLLFHYRQ